MSNGFSINDYSLDYGEAEISSEGLIHSETACRFLRWRLKTFSDHDSLEAHLAITGSQVHLTSFVQLANKGMSVYISSR